MLIAAVGNEYRHDDALGLEAARALRLESCPGSHRLVEVRGGGAALLAAWAGATQVIVIDAACTGAPPGTLIRLEVRGPLAGGIESPSTHAFGVAEAIGLARQLDLLPPRLVLLCVEGVDFSQGEGLSPAVSAALPALIAAIHTEVRAAAQGT